MREIRFSDRAKATTLWLSAVLLLFLLYETAHLLPPFLWAIVAAYIFHPLVSFMARQTGVPRAVWAILIYIAVFSGIAWTIINVGPVIRSQTIALVRSGPAALAQVEQFARQQPILGDLGLQPELGQLEREAAARADDVAAVAQRLALPIIERLAESAINLFIFLVTTFYLLLNAERVKASLIGLAPRPYQHEIEGLLRRINDSLGAYLRSQLLLVVIMSTATFVFLSIVRVEYALVIGILTGFLELIPFIGPYSAGAIAVSVALFQGTAPFGWSSLTLAIVVAVGYFVLRQLEDTLIIPTLIGRVVHLNPILVIFVLMSGATIGGILGLLIAVPVAAVIRILAQYLYTKVLSREPPYVVPIGSLDDPVQRLLEAADAGAKRLVLVSPDSNPALQQTGTYQKLARVISTEDLDVTFISSDTIARGLAQTHGMRLVNPAA